MKFFASMNPVPLAFKDVSVKPKLVSRGSKQGTFIMLGVFAMIIGFVLAVAMRFLSAMLTFPLAGLLCGSLLFTMFLNATRISSLVAGVRPNPHDISVLDLLERSAVPMEITEGVASLKGQVILVTGAAGSIGSELCKQLLDCEPSLLIALDTNETGLFDLVESLRTHAHPQLGSLQPFIGDITDIKRMSRLFAEKRPGIVFHAAAYKHVPLLERFPDLAIRTNSLATYHLCRLAQENKTSCFIFISTDKAAEPISVMGASKRLAEIIVQAMAKSAKTTTRFCAVRFGNVIGSRGSVVPVFARQIAQGGPLTITDARATRYFMTIPEACGLVIRASILPDQGGLYLLDMGDPVQIIDLAVKMVHLCNLRVGKDISIVYTGLRPGERIHEILCAENEEVVATDYDKIFRLKSKANLPEIETIVQWIDMLEKSVRVEDNNRQREYLFGLIGSQKLAVVS